MWDALTGDELFELKHRKIVRAADWSADSAHIVTGGKEGVLRLYDVNRPAAEPLTLSLTLTLTPTPTLALTLTLTLTPTPTPTLSLSLTLTQSRRLAELIPDAQLHFFAGGHGFATSNPAVVPFLSD